MAGETPDASRIGKQRDKKKTGKRLTHLDEKKTDKYYASGAPSAINNSPADTRGNVAAKPQANNVGFGPLDERSADKKYYKERSPSGQKPVARHLAKAMQAAPAASTTRAVSDLTIRTGVEVNPVMDEVVRRLQNGDTNVIVTVAAIVMRRARAKLDTLVTRELITEEQSRDVRFSRLMDDASAEAVPALDAPPVPTETIRTEETDADVAIDDILSGNASLDDDGPSTAPENVQEVDDVDEPPSPQPTVAAETEEETTEAADPLDADTEAPAETEEDALSPEGSEEADDDADDSDVARDEESDEDEESDA